MSGRAASALGGLLGAYTAEQARRRSAPGVTGLAQARGRNALSWEEKFKLDVEYVDRRSMALDLRILCGGRSARSYSARVSMNKTGDDVRVRWQSTLEQEVRQDDER